jgi:hypothetical protein
MGRFRLTLDVSSPALTLGLALGVLLGDVDPLVRKEESSDNRDRRFAQTSDQRSRSPERVITIARTDRS